MRKIIHTTYYLKKCCNNRDHYNDNYFETILDTRDPKII